MIKIEEIFKKYNMELDYGKMYQSISSLIREYNYLKETYYRLSLGKEIGLAPSVTSMPSVVHFNYLFTDDYFSYNLQNSEHHKEELENFYKAVLFLDSNFYIDEGWDLQKAILLKAMLEDEDINTLCLQTFDKNSWEMVRESSYYYKDDVWKFVVENKLLPYMRNAKPSTGESDSTSQSTNGESEVTDKESQDE